MTEVMFKAVLDRAGCEKTKNGGAVLPDGRHLTLYVARSGTQLSVGKVVKLAISGGLVQTENVKGETFLLSIDDLFAASVSGDAKAPGGRKAGFLG